MAVEATRVARIIYTTLATDPALQGLLGASGSVCADMAPSPTDPLPQIVFFPVDAGGEAGTTIEGFRVLTVSTWTAKAIVDGRSYAPAEQLADRVDALLHGFAGTIVDGVAVDDITRTETVMYPEQAEGGHQYRHLGGTYRVTAYTTS